MKTNFKPRSLKRSITLLFTPKVEAHDQIEQPLTEYMAKLTRLQARREVRVVAHGQPLQKPSDFTKELRKLSSERGMKIWRFTWQ